MWQCVHFTPSTSPPWVFHIQVLICHVTLLFWSSTGICVGKHQTQKRLPQVRSRHWWTLNSRGKEVLLAFKELSKLLLMVISKSLLQSFCPIFSSCQGCAWEAVAVGDADLGYSHSPLPPQPQAKPDAITFDMVNGLAPLAGPQVPPMPPHGDLFIPGHRPCLGSSHREDPADELWLGSTCCGDTLRTRAMPTSWSMLHVALIHLRTMWWPLLVTRRTHSASRTGRIQTNFGHAAAVTVSKGTLL